MIELILTVLAILFYVGYLGAMLTIGLLPISLTLMWLSPGNDGSDIQKILDESS